MDGGMNRCDVKIVNYCKDKFYVVGQMLIKLNVILGVGGLFGGYN